MKFKRTLATLIAVVTLGTGIGAVSASADNTDTKIESFTIYPGISNTFTPLSTGDQNGIRVKENSSNVYIYITNSTYSSIYVQTWGLNDTRWDCSEKDNRTCNASGAETSRVVLQEGSKYRVKNSIKANNSDSDEDPYVCAGLKFQSSSHYYSDTISGVWSPDYVTESGVLLADD